MSNGECTGQYDNQRLKFRMSKLLQQKRQEQLGRQTINQDKNTLHPEQPEKRHLNVGITAIH